MQNLPEEVIHKINDFRIGDHEYWKNEYNKVMNQLEDINVFKRIKEVMLKNDAEIYQYYWRQGYYDSNY